MSYMIKKSMEARKVQKTGTSTLTVSLPKEWVLANGLKPGDQVNVEMMIDGSLAVSSASHKKRERSTCTLTTGTNEPEEHLTRKLISAYLAGYNLIEVRSKERMDLSTKHTIKDFARLVIGPEVIEETSNSVIMHDLSDPVELPQKKCVRRMHLLVDGMHRDAMTAFEKGDKELADDVSDRDQDVDRLYWMTVKQFNLVQLDRSLGERIGVDATGAMTYTLVARMLERVGDHAEKIAGYASIHSEHGTEWTQEIKEIDDLALNALNRSMESFFKMDMLSANEIIDRSKELLHKADELMHNVQSKGGKGAAVRTSVLDSIVRVINYAIDIAELAINDSIRTMYNSNE